MLNPFLLFVWCHNCKRPINGFHYVFCESGEKLVSEKFQELFYDIKNHYGNEPHNHRCEVMAAPISMARTTQYTSEEAADFKIGAEEGEEK